MLDWFANEGTIDRLIATKHYPRAAKLIRSELKKAPKSVRLRQKLADVLLNDGRIEDGAKLCEKLVDEFARAGFFGRAIAVIKKLQRFQPESTRIEAKLAAVIKMKEGEEGAPSPLGPKRPLDPKRPIDVVPAAPVEVAPEPPSVYSDEGIAKELQETAVHLRLGLVKDFADEEPKAGGLQGSPLFNGLTEDQLLAVIRGLRLATFGPGEIIVTEQEPGQSMFLIAGGAVRIYVRRDDGGNAQVRTMEQGDFFGEISLLSGLPRTATITAAAQCELLELGRDDLEKIAVEQPEVIGIVERFCSQRAGSAEELEARQSQ